MKIKDIIIKNRYRKDIGNLDRLKNSIQNIGAFECMSKPFDINSMLETIRHALNKN